MDEDIVELIAAMCTRAGMIMEDASLLAVTMPRHNPNAVRDALGRLRSSLDTCRQLIAAATALHQPIGGESRLASQDLHPDRRGSGPTTHLELSLSRHHINEMAAANRIRVIDLETTGSQPSAHGVCEIGWQDVVRNDIGLWSVNEERGALFVNPGRPIPAVTMGAAAMGLPRKTRSRRRRAA